MQGLLFNILGSLIAALIALIIAGIISQRARFALTALTTGFLGIDTEYVYPNRAVAQPDMEREFLRAKFVYLLTGRGQEMQTEPFAKLLGERPPGLKTKFRVLLPQIDVPAECVDWTAVNEKELADFDPGYPGLLRSQ